jgi:hypothetical protein
MKQLLYLKNKKKWHDFGTIFFPLVALFFSNCPLLIWFKSG